MIAHFFIRRPVFAWVISIVIMLAGLLAITQLPVSQYPNVAPPSIRISTTYNGASAETVENSVTQIIEQQLTGLDGLLYFSSSSSSTGRASIDVTFEQGTDPDTAQVQVQNKVQQITSNLPTSVQQQGVTVTKSQSDFLLIMALYDENDQAMASDLSDYLVSNMQDPISRLEGVGSVQIFGTAYAMRIWLDPLKLATYNLIPSDVANAIKAQNIQVAAGSLGSYPIANGQELNATVTAQSKLETPEQFENIILKYDDNGATVRIKNVAKVEIGSENYNFSPRLNGHPSTGLAVMLAPSANALETSERVKAAIEELKRDLPQGYKTALPLDSTEFIKISIEEVVKTLFEAIVLVVIVMFVFLQSWRATLIPAIAVPVVLLGTFGVLQAFGYSINTLTMFALVLSIGLLVDDAIVVVENVERVMEEENLPPREATIKSMKEITSALIGITVVLSAVFVPMAFFSGSTGVIYRQFSITIVSSMVLSVIVALTLSPALCATLLKKPNHHGEKPGLAGWFNRNFDRMTDRYSNRVKRLIRQPVRWFAGYLVIVAGMGYLMVNTPTGFLPTEDQGNVMVIVSLPEGASMARTEEVMAQIQDHFLEKEKDYVDSIFTISGFSFMGTGQNAGMAFVLLKHWDERTEPGSSASDIVGRSYPGLAGIRDAQIFSLLPPSIRGLGQSNGFTFELQAAGNTDRQTLLEMRDRLLGDARASQILSGVRMGGQGETPQLHIDIDQEKAFALGLSMADISSTLSSAWAGNYVNDFIDRGRVKKVYIQGEAEYRGAPSDLQHWYVRGNGDEMTPFSAFADSEWAFGPKVLTRFNGLPSYEIQGSAAPGLSSGDAMVEMSRLADQLPQGTSYAWSGLSYQEQQSGGQTYFLYAVSILVVFLCLAALYESWTVPFSVILVIPLGVIGAAGAIYLRDLQNDVYFQVALLTIIGLSSKNAILIVEFAEAAYRRGEDIWHAAAEGARLRLRPIIMTSLAFIVGTMPLALSSGAGANSRISIGSGIVGGTLTATVLAIFFVPLFFVIVRKLFPKRPEHDV
ncbi:efflux RND transporter permease subunit [Marinomonas fungiae]|uniref:Efflux pump membrane transporter n=1 Tax=Marinomonas fungiae TaxID=1137284 RepID=A0A0K6IQM9_9GAMM|nr:efflux RND transporter permease subunit [Marinomonas fungiae]CUB05399.1 The (Largely Gram-negative Bacterial) Hydrophobe/Amphiphile Efflux-1 (HAE1) Family [Marinomonas fungiae]